MVTIKKILIKKILNIPRHLETIKINSKDNNKFNILIFSKNKVYNSVITISKLKIYNFLKKNTNVSKNKIDKLTNDLFDILNNELDETNFDNIYNELNLLCDKKS